ncbi:unnamed protein product [Ostreobium quekettii]|uniref:Uncharacterized protein n=1 Tax=Ostreobium quekettii TaxID=121088 RepID=A0A8S1IY15_9CHLO|nr:unnamed protein product [Ostreobium quekettii]
MKPSEHGLLAFCWAVEWKDHSTVRWRWGMSAYELKLERAENLWAPRVHSWNYAGQLALNFRFRDSISTNKDVHCSGAFARTKRVVGGCSFLGTLALSNAHAPKGLPTAALRTATRDALVLLFWTAVQRCAQGPLTGRHRRALSIKNKTGVVVASQTQTGMQFCYGVAIVQRRGSALSMTAGHSTLHAATAGTHPQLLNWPTMLHCKINIVQ